MATYVPAKVSTQFVFYASLVSQANTKLMQVNPTIASGDFKVSIDGAALANLGTLPAVTPAGSTMVKFTLSTSEMAGANATVVCIDAAGAEWCDLVINIQTAARQVDDLAFPATTGRSMVVDASGLVDANAVKLGPSGGGTAQTARDVGTSVLLSTGTGTGQLDFTSGVVKANATQILGGTIPAVNVTGVPLVDLKYTLGTISPATAGSVRADAVTGAVGSVTGNVGGSVASVTAGVSVGTGGIVSGSFAASAIDSAALATSAAQEIRDAILSDATTFAGASIAAIKAKTDNLPEGIKKNTALAAFEFFMADSADHVTGKTGLTVAGAVSIDGGAFGALTNTPATEVANGIYKIDLAAADLNGTVLTLKFTSAGADATLVTIKTNL